MKKVAMQRAIPGVVLTALTAVPGGAALAASTPTPTTSARVFKGPLVDQRWGPVQAVITVKNKKITKVSITVSPENPRSQFIDEQAVPILKTETLQAQNATIDGVSGATDTSDAYVQSLQSAVKKAKKAKVLK